MDRQLLDELHAVAGLEDAEIVAIDPSRRHPHILFHYSGKLYRHALPRSPHDGRGLTNVIRNFRRRLRQLKRAHADRSAVC